MNTFPNSSRFFFKGIFFVCVRSDGKEILALLLTRLHALKKLSNDFLSLASL